MYPHAALDKAMADGIVDFTGIDSVLVGVGGAGKTHTLLMITNQSAPEVRVSTVTFNLDPPKIVPPF